ncbi:MAG: caspase family protein [Proteobacteria bacterium]|nr:caspase family protein [Pseudomonadota bacterium]
MRALLLAGLLFHSVALAGETRRYALVIGANEGNLADGPLYFAERDAERVADVLTRAGGVYEENAVLLRAPAAARVEQAIHRLGSRIAADRASGAVDEALVFFYYSGHGDATSLHLGQSQLMLGKLTDSLDTMGADLRVVVVDACRSGELTRIKGAKPAAPFEFTIDEDLMSQGTAIITSSSSGEDAQESDNLEGGVFTHHFVAGLLGAADVSGDGEVTLTEAYHYGSTQTIRTTSSAPFVQHPTYRFDLAGTQDLVLTRIASDRAGVLTLAKAGDYVVLGRRGDVLTEVSVGDAGQIALPAGSYTVRYRGVSEVREAELQLRAGTSATLDASDMTALPAGLVVRKGLATERRAFAVTTGAGVSAAIVPDMTPGVAATLGVRVDTPAATLLPRLRYAHHLHRNSDLTLRQHALGIDVGAYRLFDLGPTALGPGLRVGVDGVMQTFQTRGKAPNRQAFVPRTGPALRFEVAPARRWLLGLEGGVDLGLVPMQQKLSTQVAPHVALDLSLYR